jgi:hypothetical protein
MSDLQESEKEIKRLQHLKKDVDKSGDLTKIARFNEAATKAVAEHTKAKKAEMEKKNDANARGTAELGAEFLIDRGKVGKNKFSPDDYMRYYYPKSFKESQERKSL